MDQAEQNEHGLRNKDEMHNENDHFKKESIGTGQNVPEIKIEHPSSNYSVSELYMIRKESIIHANDLIRKELMKSFHRHAKIKTEDHEKDPSREYDPEFSKIRRSFRKLHELYKIGSKAEEITFQKREKMRARVERTERAAKRDEMILAGSLDMSKAYIRQGHTQMNSSYKSAQK